MARLVLVDTVSELPGLLPLHAWSALMSCDLVVVGRDDHPLAVHLDMADLRWEVVAGGAETGGLSRADLLSGLSRVDKARAEAVVDRVHEAGEVVYLLDAGDHEAFTRAVGLQAARASVEVEVVYFGARPKGTRLLELVAVEQRLRGPGGCPWDAEQDHRSLARYAVEEVYELAEAIDADDVDAIREELGDLLLQVVFHAQVAEDNAGDHRPGFTIDDVAGGIVDKLVRRHPHVFGDATVAGADEVAANWEQLKAAEKPERTGIFDGVPPAQPALGYAEALQRRAAKAGFDWSADAEAAERIRAELEEFLAAEDDGARAAELGDLLLSVVGLARRHHIDAETALRGAAGRFRRRLEAVVAAADRPLSSLTRDDWLALWDGAKADERSSAPPDAS